VLIVCMAARACGSGLPAAGAAAAAVPVVPAAMRGGFSTPSSVEAEGATLAPEILEPQHVEEAAPVEEATEPEPEPVEEEHAAAEAVPPITAAQESRAASPSVDVAGVVEEGEAKAPSAAGGEGTEATGAEAKGAEASIEEVLLGAGFEVAGKSEVAEGSEVVGESHATEEQAKEQVAKSMKKFVFLKEALRMSYKHGLTLRGDTGGAHPDEHYPRIVFNRPGAPKHEVDAQRRALKKEIRKSLTTEEDLKRWKAQDEAHIPEVSGDEKPEQTYEEFLQLLAARERTRKKEPNLNPQP